MDEEEKKEVVESTETTNTTPGEKKGFNITSLILGIVSVLCFCWWYISIPTGIIAIIFSIAGKNEAGRGMGVAGMVLGIIGLALCILIYLLAILGVASLAALS